MRLQEMKGRISGTRMWDRGEERADNGVGLFQGGDESGGRGLGGGDEASAANFDGEEGLGAGGVGKMATKEAREGRQLKGVEVFVDGEKRLGIAGAYTIGHFGERKAES